MIAFLRAITTGRRVRAPAALLAAAVLWPGGAFAQVVVEITDPAGGPPGPPAQIFVGTPVTFAAEQTTPNACSGTIGEQWWIEDENGVVVGGQAGLADESPCQAPRSFVYTFSAPGDYTVHYGYTNDLGFFEALFCYFGVCPPPDSSGSVSLRVRPGGGGGNPGSFQVDAAANASTCSGIGGIPPFDVTVTVRNNGGAVLRNYSGTVTLATSAGHGTWSNGDGLGTLSDPTADDGAASYRFDANDDGAVVLQLENQHADDLTVTVSDGNATGTSRTIAFRDNALVITDVDGLAPGDVPVAGRDHALRATLWRRDPSSGDCAVATAYSGGIDLKAWYTGSGNHPAGAAAPDIGGTAIPNSPPVSNNVSLVFDAGVADFLLGTSDVGQYHLNLTDDGSGFAVDTSGNPRPVSGGTATQLTVRPFAFGFTDIAQLAAPGRANPGAAASAGAAGSGFVAADEGFRATAGAYRWAGGDDSDDDGVPDSGADVTDNGLTGAFAADLTLAASPPFTPASGTLGTLTGTAPQVADFSGGTATVSDLAYDEVGSMVLRAEVRDYLGTGGADVSGVSGPVGRFYPERFRLTGASLSPACGSFSYMGQTGIGLSYRIEALNRSGTRTVNYDNRALDYAVGGVVHVAENDNDGSDLSARLSDPPGTLTWGAGRFEASLADAVFARALGGPDGPYVNLAVGVSVNNSDGTRIAGVDMDPAAATDCTADDSCTALRIATTQARFGRASVENAFGSEYLDLAVPLRASFYAGEALGFLPNPDDACSTPLSVALADADPGDALDYGARDTCVQDSGSPGASGAGCTEVAPVARQFTDPPLAGDFNLWLRAPGADKTGAVRVDATVPAWLEYDWDGDGFHDNPPPTARAMFGSYRGDDRIIYWRERFE